MRNKIYSWLWQIVGMYAAMRVFELPWAIFLRILSHFIDVTQPPFNLVLAAIGVALFLMAAVWGGRWFLHLFHRGELWGYRPESNSY